MKSGPARIHWLILDIDGVLTDGYDSVPAGEKRLLLRDLDALARARREGLGIAFLTGESADVSAPLVERCGGGPALYGVKDKAEGMHRLVEQLGCSLEDVCYVADGERDAPALDLAGVGLTPCDASPVARAVADCVLTARGGGGAVEETVAFLLGAEWAVRAGVECSLRTELESAALAVRALAEAGVNDLVRATNVMARSLSAAGRVLVFGNGGSAAVAQHFATELVGRYRQHRRALPALALTADTALLTAVANDLGFERVFERQVEALVRYGDVAVGMSTSGLSENVARGLAVARRFGAHTVALVGEEKGIVGSEAQVCLTFPARDTARIQELHLLALHAICQQLDELFAPKAGLGAKDR